MFSSISFASKTTQMGPQSICDLDLELIEENSDEAFMTQDNAVLLDAYHFEDPIHLHSDHSNDDFPIIQEVFYKKHSNLDEHQHEHQCVLESNFNDLNLIEETFPSISHNNTQKINELMLKKVEFRDFVLHKKNGLEEVFIKRKTFIDDQKEIQKEIQKEPLNLSAMITISRIEENSFDIFDNSYEKALKMEGPKIDFAISKETQTTLLPRTMPKLNFPDFNSETHHELRPSQKSDNQTTQMIPEIVKSNPNDLSLKEKCSQSSQTEATNLSKSNDTNASNSKSRLFPASSKSVTPVKTSTDIRNALIIDERIISLPGFQQIFADYRIIFRTLKSYDIEINERTCIIFRPLLIKSEFHKDLKSFSVSHDQIVESLIKFEDVFIVISLEDEFAQYKEISEEKLKLLSFIYGNKISVKIREFPTNKSAFNFIHSLVDDSHKFLRDCESLHEHLLSLFPTISKSLAQAILMKGNPIVDCSITLDEFPNYNIIPFKQVLDTVSDSYKINKAKNQVNTENKSEKLPYAIETDIQPLCPSSNRKISAPFPSTILLANEI